MNAFTSFFAALFNHQTNAGAARQLLERAAQSRGQSHGDAEQLRDNALAVLRVVR